MTVNLRSLFLEPDVSSVAPLIEALAPELYFIDKRSFTSLAEALTVLITEKVDVCFVSGRFSKERINTFAIDARSIKRNKNTALVLVQDELVVGQNNEPVCPEGFSAVISRQVSEGDKERLAKVTAKDPAKIREDEIIEMTEVVAGTTELIYKEVDAVASDKKRGVEAPYNKVLIDYVKSLAGKHGEVLEAYFDSLADKAPKTPPKEFERIRVQQRVLARKLPKLGQDNYTGVSRRVWKSLVKRMRDDS